MRKLLVALLLLFFAVTAAADTIVIAVRHAEKADESQDAALSPEGQKRAELLARMLRDAGVAAIYSTPFQRTRNTAAPLAAQLGLRVTEDNAEAPALAKRILRENRGKSVLVVGHSNTIPALLTALGVATPITIASAEFDNLFVVVVPDRGKARLVRLRYGFQP